MFRDLKEYQDIAKIYADKVSKPENLEERRGSSVQQLAQNRANAFKPATPPQGGAGGGVGNPTNVRGSGAKPRPKPEVKKFPSTAEIRAANQGRVGGGNAGASTDSGGTSQSTIKSVEQKPEIKKPEPKPQSKFIRDPKTKTLRKRGTVTARRAENLEKNKLNAQAMAKERIAAKKDGTASPQMSGKEKAQAMAKARLAAKNKPVASASKKIDGAGLAAKMDKENSAKPAAKPSGNTSALNVSSGTPTRKVTSSTTQSGNTTSTKTKVTSGTGGGTEGLTKSAGSLADNKKKAERMRKIAAQNAAMEAEFESKQFDAYDLVLEYLLSSEQVATIEEANYVMTEMDAETIQGIVEAQKKNFDEGAGVAAAALAGGLLTYGLYKRNQYKKDAEKRDEKTNFGKIQKATDAKNKLLKDAGM